MAGSLGKKGPKVNTAKTEVLVRLQDEQQKENQWKKHGEKLDQVTEFKYLGSEKGCQGNNHGSLVEEVWTTWSHA